MCGQKNCNKCGWRFNKKNMLLGETYKLPHVVYSTSVIFQKPHVFDHHSNAHLFA